MTDKKKVDDLPDMLMGDVAIEFKHDGQKRNHNPQIAAYQQLGAMANPCRDAAVPVYRHPHLNTDSLE